MATVKDSFENFDGQEEVKLVWKPLIKLFNKWNKFIGFLQSIRDNPSAVWIDNWYGKEVFGNKVFTFVAISWKDERRNAGGEAIDNPIVPWVEYNYFTNYNFPNLLEIKWNKLAGLPLWAIVKLENMGKKKAEGSKYFYNFMSIIWKKDEKCEYIIHPDYKAVDNFEWQEEISVEDVPF